MEYHKYLKYKNKYLQLKKKSLQLGGITSMSGLYAFFINKAEWIKLFGEVVKDKDAPSIKDIEHKLKAKGYYIENKSKYINLIGVEGSKNSSSYKKHFLQSSCYGERTKRTKRDRHGGLEEYYTTDNIICHAAMLNNQFDISSEDRIQDVFALIHNHMLFSNIVITDDKFSTVKNPLNIDYCVVIDVSRLTKNIFIKSVDYVQNVDRTNRVDNIAQEYYTEACEQYIKNYRVSKDPLECQYTFRNNP
jgi:hypothetical protein